MSKNSKNIQKAIWKTRLPAIKTAVAALLLILFIGAIILAPKIPSGPSREVTAFVESIGVAHGATGSGTYLVCNLDDGKKARVFLDNQLPIIKGMKVVILESPRLIGGSKYQFIRVYE